MKSNQSPITGGTEPKRRLHFTAEYLLNPVHPVSVTLVGAGGNGGQMLSCLARINTALREKGHPGLQVTVWDADTVSRANIGRQLFGESEIGMNKAVALVSRFNRFYLTEWEAQPQFFTSSDSPGNILVTCVDTIAARKVASAAFRSAAATPGPEHKHYYWLDLGNARTTAQAVLGSARIPQPASRKYETVAKLPIVTSVFDYSKVDERDSGPSCSLAEALTKQDLFINSSLCQMAGSLLWGLFNDMYTAARGFYLNLDTFRTSPISI